MSDKDNDDNNDGDGDKELAPPPTEPTTACSLDLRNSGKIVSVYVLNQVVDALEGLQPGESLDLATDSYTGLRHDIVAWGRLSGHDVHQVVPQEQGGDNKFAANTDHYVVTKATTVSSHPKERFAIVISSDILDELISPLGFALAAATAGMEVAIFFQGPAVRVLRKGFRGTLRGPPPFRAPLVGSALARRGMAAMGHDPPAVKLQQLHSLGAKFYACHPSMDHFGVKTTNELAFDDVTLGEYVTFLEVMRHATVQMYP